MTVSEAQSGASLASEIELARAWWRFGGGRSEKGKWERLKLLRTLGDTVIRQPGLAAFDADQLDASALAELLRLETLREQRAGATVRLGHDTLRDWTVGFLLDEQPELFGVLPTDRPLPGALARGLEIAARLALENEPTGARWPAMLTRFEADGIHGSWRRPILLALPRAENAITLLDRRATVLLEDRARRLREIIRLLIGADSIPMSEMIGAALKTHGITAEIPAELVAPKGAAWGAVVAWIATTPQPLPSAIIPDAAKLFRLWLIATHHVYPDIDAVIVRLLHQWLRRIEEARRPLARHEIGIAAEIDLDFENLSGVHDEIRQTFLAFCHLSPEAAARYLSETEPDWHHGAREVVRFAHRAAQAAPAKLATFALAALIPEEDEEERIQPKRLQFSPFGAIDADFIPVSPGQAPFFDLLQGSPAEGLRLVRGIVEHATNWQREKAVELDEPFPAATILFPEDAKTFHGPFGIYQWARGGTGPQVVASALMALEAWAHRQIEGGRPFDDVLHDVLGPSGSSIAFLCVAADLVLSHWSHARASAWPMLAVPELLQFDHMRLVQDLTGMGRFFNQAAEPSYWPVTTADLTSRSSRRRALANLIGDVSLHGPAEAHSALREMLEAADRRIASTPHPSDVDGVHGLRATAARALRMTDPDNWPVQMIQLEDGREVPCRQYLPSAEELALRAEGSNTATANIENLNGQLIIQKALQEPATATPEIVARAVARARAQSFPAVEDLADGAGPEEFEEASAKRAVTMAAALAARDYDGADRNDIVAWSERILANAVALTPDDIAARAGGHIYASPTAIAAIGYSALYRRDGSLDARNMLLKLGTRCDLPVLQALGHDLRVLEQLDDRVPRALTRLALDAAIYPRGGLDWEERQARLEARRLRLQAAVAAEIAWLDGAGAEPVLPTFPTWPSTPPRYIRLGAPSFDERDEAIEPVPAGHVNEQSASAWMGCLVSLAIGAKFGWLVALSDQLMTWTIEANNGPAGGRDLERGNRPYFWNSGFFRFAGILSAVLSPSQTASLFLQPMSRLHDEAFCDAAADFLYGFDIATLDPTSGSRKTRRRCVPLWWSGCAAGAPFKDLIARYRFGSRRIWAVR